MKSIFSIHTGKFLIGGFDGDAVNRADVVDAYQSFANVGGGCMNGKTQLKLILMQPKARQIAVRYLKEHNLKWCEVQLSYAIGVKQPLAIYIVSDKGNIEAPESLYKECELKRL